MKLTRRKLAVVLASGSVAAAAAAQTPQPPAPAEDLNKAARDRMLAHAAALATPAIPMATEPAFQFKA